MAAEPVGNGRSLQLTPVLLPRGEAFSVIFYESYRADPVAGTGDQENRNLIVVACFQCIEVIHIFFEGRNQFNKAVQVEDLHEVPAHIVNAGNRACQSCEN